MSISTPHHTPIVCNHPVFGILQCRDIVMSQWYTRSVYNLLFILHKNSRSTLLQTYLICIAYKDGVRFVRFVRTQNVNPRKYLKQTLLDKTLLDPIYLYSLYKHTIVASWKTYNRSVDSLTNRPTDQPTPPLLVNHSSIQIPSPISDSSPPRCTHRTSILPPFPFISPSSVSTLPP